MALLALVPGNNGGNNTITTADPGFASVTPTQTGLPGGSTATIIVSGVIFYSLLLTLVGIVLSAGLWAVGSFSNNYTQSINGKKGFLICAAAALAIGASYFLVQWFFGAGTGTKS